MGMHKSKKQVRKDTVKMLKSVINMVKQDDVRVREMSIERPPIDVTSSGAVWREIIAGDETTITLRLDHKR